MKKLIPYMLMLFIFSYSASHVVNTNKFNKIIVDRIDTERIISDLTGDTLKLKLKSYE